MGGREGGGRANSYQNFYLPSEINWGGGGGGGKGRGGAEPILIRIFISLLKLICGGGAGGGGAEPILIRIYLLK